MRFVKSEPMRSRYHETRLNWIDRLLVRTYDREGGLNQNMFREDFLNIFLHGTPRSGKLFDIKTNNYKLTHRLLNNVQTRYDFGSIDENLVHLIEEIAQSFMYFGRAFYYLHDDNEKDETKIVSYSSESIFRFAGKTIQYIPNRVDRNWDREDVTTGRELRFLDAQKILYFRWPASIRGNIMSLNKVLATLDKYDSSVALKFQSQVTHDNPNPRNYFEFKKWHTIHDLVLFKATKKIGWSARKYDSSKKSDFFDCHRWILFRRLQLELRDHTLNQLSKQLSRVGKNYCPNYKIDILATNKLPSIAHLDDLEARLIREEASFDEVIDYCIMS